MKLKYPEHYNRAEDPITFPLAAPILVRLLEPVGLLPAAFVYALPRFEAERLIRRRKAVAVGSQDVQPDLVISEDDWGLATA